MDQKGYKSFDEIRGIALKDITTVEKLAEMPPLFAEIDADKCTAAASASVRASIARSKSRATSAPPTRASATGCGLCAQLCPAKAITLR